MVPITEPLELVDLPPSENTTTGGVVVPIRGRVPARVANAPTHTDFRPHRPAESSEPAE